MKIKLIPTIFLAASLLLCACSDDAGHPGGIDVPTPVRELHCAPDASIATTTPTTLPTVACKASASTAS